MNNTSSKVEIVFGETTNNTSGELGGCAPQIIIKGEGKGREGRGENESTPNCE